MTDEVFPMDDPSDLAGGSWFKAADNEGCTVIFAGFRPAGSDDWGNDIAKGSIMVLDHPDDGIVVYAPGELKGNLMAKALKAKGAVMGKLVKGEASKAGMNPPWILEDCDEDQKAAGRTLWLKHMEQDSSGSWIPKLDPNEAPF